FKAKKTLEGGDVEAEQFSFTLVEYTDDTFQTVKDGGVSQTRTNAAPVSPATYGDIVFDSVTLTDTTTRYFKIKETIPTGQADDGTIIYDINEHNITVAVTDDGAGHLNPTKRPAANEGYDASFTNIKKGSLKITKIAKVGDVGAETLNDSRKAMADGTYTFNVYTDSTAQTLANKADGTAIGDVTVKIENGAAKSVAEVTGLAPGTYYVKETAGTNDAVSLDTAIYAVTVEAGKTGDTVASTATATATNTLPVGTLTVTKTIASTSGEAISGTYTYPVEITVTLDGTTYYVQSANGELATTAPETSLTVSNGTDLTISNLPYGSYTVTETNPGSVEITDYAYVEVEGSDSSGTGTVDATARQVDLVNKYTKGTSWTPTVGKLLNQQNYNGSDYSFVLTDTTTGRSYTETISAATNGVVAFTAIPFTAINAGHDYTYTITETSGSAENMRYDSRTVYVKVEVRNNGGTLSATPTYYSDAEMQTEWTTPTFENWDLVDISIDKAWFNSNDSVNNINSTLDNATITVKLQKQNGVDANNEPVWVDVGEA
ncbi:MAG: hypothetical protein IJH04_03380, partial [Eggerthellaceae bacterium]|nr:hypothetical protein [Eggerthellaceae bacterium]